MALTIQEQAQRLKDLNRSLPAARKWSLGTLMDVLANIGVPSISVATESGNNIDVTVQINDPLGNAVAEQRSYRMWLSDTAGGAVTADPPSGGLSMTTGNLQLVTSEGIEGYEAAATDVFGWLVTDSTGLAVIRLSEAGVDTFYLNIVDGLGRVWSTAVTFA